MEISNSMSMWEDEQKLAEIKKIFAPTLTETEFSFFIGMGKANDLNPFLREIWAIKYDAKGTAQVFIGRDGYRKSAQRNPDYKYHKVEAVYENDIFQHINGKITHTYGVANRGRLYGAYCQVFKNSIDEPISVYVPLDEYSTNKSLWNKETGKQSTMIKKVAEAQCLRMAFQEQYAGTYSEYENFVTEDGVELSIKKSQASKMTSLLNKKGLNNAKNINDGQNNCHVVNPIPCDQDGVVIDQNNDFEAQTNNTTASAKMAKNGEPESSFNDSPDATLPCTAEQLDAIDCLLSEKQVDKAGQLKCLDHFGKTSFAELTIKEAAAVIKKLNSLDIPE
jgi:phage recombination protein Bet